MEFDHIINLSPEKLYEKALEFESSEDHDNYAIYLKMSANYGYKLAENAILNRANMCIGSNENYSKTKLFYETTKSYGYSANTLGYIYLNGRGVERDLDKVKELFEIGCSKNNVLAMYNLSYIYYYGLGVPVDYDKAEELCKSSFERGYEIAFNLLSYAYRMNIFKKDKMEIINYFHKINKPKKVKQIFGYDDYTLELIINNYKITKENSELANKISELANKITELENKNNDLETHIMASPDGPLYFEAKENWHANSGIVSNQ